MSGPHRGPSITVVIPQATLTFGQCALGLPQVKAAGLVVVFDHASMENQAPSCHAAMMALITMCLCNLGEFSPDTNRKNKKHYICTCVLYDNRRVCHSCIILRHQMTTQSPNYEPIKMLSLMKTKRLFLQWMLVMFTCLAGMLSVTGERGLRPRSRPHLLSGFLGRLADNSLVRLPCL